mmetsp:Transcript_23623/g.89716  ORF Transcript_23623/g.89716 Transcript_23623/m.89716 type:complete len:232 (+) Transcript_23623:1156-1851(+)
MRSRPVTSTATFTACAPARSATNRVKPAPMRTSRESPNSRKALSPWARCFERAYPAARVHTPRWKAAAQTKATKSRWLPAPTGQPSQTQKWSIRATQRPLTLQWDARRGLCSRQDSQTAAGGSPSVRAPQIAARLSAEGAAGARPGSGAGMRPYSARWRQYRASGRVNADPHGGEGSAASSAAADPAGRNPGSDHRVASASHIATTPLKYTKVTTSALSHTSGRISQAPAA